MGEETSAEPSAPIAAKRASIVALRVGVLDTARVARLLERRKESSFLPDARMKPRNSGEGFPGLEEGGRESTVVFRRNQRDRDGHHL